jgi:hypothetical protein
LVVDFLGIADSIAGMCSHRFELDVSRHIWDPFLACSRSQNFSTHLEIMYSVLSIVPKRLVKA